MQPKQSNEHNHCEICQFNETSLEKACKKLNDGGLVSFPTETVYGLGANALNETAVLNIFKAKERPLTDPIIVHVASVDQIPDLVTISNKESSFLNFLWQEKLWPGPLTIIFPAKTTVISKFLTADTGFVGIRIPNHPLALELLSKSKLPIAAPSANMFGHVSPTTADHVLSDFMYKDILVLDGGSSTLGIESTVIKLNLSEDEETVSVQVYRNGSLSVQTLKNALTKFGQFKEITIEQKKRESHVSSNVSTVAPGQILKHYSPNIDAYILINEPRCEINSTILLSKSELSTVILVDFGKKYIGIHSQFLKVYELSENRNFIEAMKKFYSILREAEKVAGATHILITDPTIPEGAVIGEEFVETIYDKIFRCASGNKVYWRNEKIYLYESNIAQLTENSLQNLQKQNRQKNCLNASNIIKWIKLTITKYLEN